ncbi:MAG: alpha/beta fold hydrolase [Asticcacaulis sp.]
MKKILCILLPGLDGTGKFFKEFTSEIACYADPVLISYPQDRLLSYQGLVDYVNTKLPIDDEYFIVAESFSGPIAISIASQHPKQLKCIILVATFASCPFPKLSLLALNILPFFIKFPVPKRVISFFLLNDQWQEMAKTVQNTIRTISRDALLCRIRNVLTCDVTEKLQNISIPVLAIQAKQDRLIPDSCTNSMSKHLPNLRVKSIDAPHFVLQTDSQAVSEKLIKPFLQEIL